MFSIPTPQPVIARPMFGGHASATSITSLAFVSNVAFTKDVGTEYRLRKKVVAVKNCRKIGKKDMKWNDTLPNIKVDPETYQVTVDDKLIQMGPAETLSMTQSVFIF
jgi:urease alpha subunit